MKEQNNRIKKLAGQTMVYGMGSILPKLLNFAILTPFYTRVLMRGSYGTVTEIYAYVVVIMVILTFGMETGFFRFCREEKSVGKVYTHAFTVVFVLAMIWVTGVMVFLKPLAHVIRYDSHPEYLKWFSWIIALDVIVSVPFAKLRQQEKAMRFAGLKLASVVINIILVFLFLLVFPWIDKMPDHSLPAWLYRSGIGVGYVFIANLATSALMFLLIIPELKDLSWSFDRKLMIKMLRFSSPLVIVGIAGAINDVADKIILKFMWPDHATALANVGVYGAGYRLAVIMTLYIQMFRYAFEPFMFSIYGRKDDKETYARIMNYFVILGLLIFLMVSFYMDGIKYFLGKNFQEGIGITPIILMANLFLGIYYSLSVWYKVKDKTLYAAVIASLGALITLVINFVFIPKIGYWASAWATLTCYVTMTICSWMWGRKIYKIPYEVNKILGWLIWAVLLFVISLVLRPESLLWRLVLNTVLLLIFAGVVAWREKGLVQLVLARIGLNKK